MITPDVFGDRLEAYQNHQNTPWSRLRYKTAQANLMRHLAGGSLAVLDAGGGNGLETVALAGLGHAVTLLDGSEKLLAEARRNAREAGVEERVEFVRGDVCSIPELFPAASFDAVLCHNVLQYVEDLDRALRGLVRAVKEAGILSVICVNRYSEAYRLAIQERNPSAALAAVDARVIRSKVFDEPMRAYAAEDLLERLERSGCDTAGRYGLLCINDCIADNEWKSNPQVCAEVEKLEFALSGVFPYYHLARFFQIVSRKRAPQGPAGMR